MGLLNGRGLRCLLAPRGLRSSVPPGLQDTTFGGAEPVSLPPQHPVDSLALIGSQHGDEGRVLDVVQGLLVSPLLLLAQVEVPDAVVELLHVLTLQVGVAVHLLRLHHL